MSRKERANGALYDAGGNLIGFDTVNVLRPDQVINREPEYDEVKRLIESGLRAVNIYGPEGVGKSSFIRLLAERANQLVPNGRKILIDAQGLYSPDLKADFMSRLAEQMGERDKGPEAILEAFGSDTFLLCIDEGGKFADPRLQGSLQAMVNYAAGAESRVIIASLTPLLELSGRSDTATYELPAIPGMTRKDAFKRMA